MARQAEQDPTNLYIANLPHSVKESDLEQMFSPYGQVLYCAVLCCTVLYCAVLCCTVLYCAVLYCTVRPGHLHQDPSGLQPAEQGRGIRQVSRG